MAPLAPPPWIRYCIFITQRKRHTVRCVACPGEGEGGGEGYPCPVRGRGGRSSLPCPGRGRRGILLPTPYPCGQTDSHLWKHYFPASFGMRAEIILFSCEIGCEVRIGKNLSCDLIIFYISVITFLPVVFLESFTGIEWLFVLQMNHVANFFCYL